MYKSSLVLALPLPLRHDYVDSFILQIIQSAKCINVSSSYSLNIPSNNFSLEKIAFSISSKKTTKNENENEKRKKDDLHLYLVLNFSTVNIAHIFH